jgi:hypothetical protein
MTEVIASDIMFGHFRLTGDFTTIDLTGPGPGGSVETTAGESGRQ